MVIVKLLATYLKTVTHQLFITTKNLFILVKALYALILPANLWITYNLFILIPMK